MTGEALAGIGFIQARRAPKSATGADDSLVTLPVAPAAPADAAQVTEALANAFINDPTWSWALPDPAARKRFWKICVDGESSNPANNRLYASAGFAPVVSFQAPGDGPWLTGMWRPARPRSA